MIDCNKGAEYLEGLGKLRLAYDNWIKQIIKIKTIDNNDSITEIEYELSTEAGRLILNEKHELKKQLLTVTLEFLDKHSSYKLDNSLNSGFRLTVDYGHVFNLPTSYKILSYGILEHLEPSEFKSFFKSLLMLDKYNIRTKLD